MTLQHVARKKTALLKACFIFGVFLSILFFANLSRAQTPEGNSCVSCHSETWDEFKGSVHGQHEILCQKCHGGDPTKSDQKEAKAPGTGFIGIPDKQQIAKVCGECHADVEAMNFYGIRTDQLARYKTSHHGKKLLLENDTKVAVCSDCHGYHDVVAVADPNSPVYPSNLPKTCNRCHGNEKIMSQYQLPSDIFDKYKNSVHGVALFEKKDISVAQCASCHGSHGAVPPGVKDVGATCGKCHINEKKYFLESPHAPLVAQGKFSECISCHSNHDVQHPTPALYKEACLKCHEANSVAYKKGIHLGRMLDDSKAKLEETEQLVKQASIEGIFVEEEAASLEETKTDMISAAPIQHTLSEEKISELHNKILSTIDGIKEKIKVKYQSLKKRKIALIPIWLFIVIMVIALWIKYKQLEGKS